MEGFDTNWNITNGDNLATYTNLNPGTYQFKVMARSLNGTWSKVKSISLIIVPPFWMTIWFKSLLVLIAGSLIYFIYWYRTKKIISQKRHLENLVRERTLGLENMRLEEQKLRQEAENANKAKDIFLASMSHEIRTPISGVIGMTTLLRDTPLTTKQKEFTDVINKCSESLLIIINDILDFSKIESGKVEIEKYDFDIRTVIEDVLDIFANQAYERNVQLYFFFDKDLPYRIKGDGQRLKQILINLVGNAVKFTENGQVSVYLKAIFENHNLTIAFKVKDTGIGIPEDKINKLFKAFSQVDSSTTRKYGGTGLGLAISQKLVVLLGGSLDVESKINSGSTFKFTVPFEKVNYHLPIVELLKQIPDEQRTAVVWCKTDVCTEMIVNRFEGIHFKTTIVMDINALTAAISSNVHQKIVVLENEILDSNTIIELIELKKQVPHINIIILTMFNTSIPFEMENITYKQITKPVRHGYFNEIICDIFKLNTKDSSSNSPVKDQPIDTEFANKYPLDILVVEDNAINQRIILFFLKKLGYQPALASNGKEAVDAVLEKNYHLIFMDIQMPVMDGIQATINIRNTPNLIQPVIIALTANVMREDITNFHKVGMNDFLGKPVKIDTLIVKLKKYGARLSRKTE